MAGTGQLVYLDHPRAMSVQQYDEVIRRLEAAGAGAPPGRLYHICYRTPDGQGLRVIDVWDSRAAMEAFAQIVVPIVQAVGVEFAGPPDVCEVHNLIAG